MGKNHSIHLMIMAAFCIAATNFALAEEPYVERLNTEVGFAQSEFDRLSKIDPVDTTYALVSATAKICQLPQQSRDLEKYVRLMGTGRNERQRSIMIATVVVQGYPKAGDRQGLCNQARRDLEKVEDWASKCRDWLKRSNGGMTTCF